MRNTRLRLLVAMLSAVLVASITAGVSREVRASHVTPELIVETRSLRCSDLLGDGQSELKVDPPRNGTFTSGSVTVAISGLDGKSFDWSSSVGIDAVYVKAGAAGSYLYRYDPPAETSGDSGLTTPGATGNEISHITFCFDTDGPPPAPVALPTATPGATPPSVALTPTASPTSAPSNVEPSPTNSPTAPTPSPELTASPAATATVVTVVTAKPTATSAASTLPTSTASPAASSLPEAAPTQVAVPSTPAPRSSAAARGSLTVFVYVDADADGERDASERGMAGVTLTVHSALAAADAGAPRLGARAPTAIGGTVATLTTDVHGIAVVVLSPNTYTVVEVVPSGWFSTDPGGDVPQKTGTVAAGGDLGLVFGNAPVRLPSTRQGGTLVVEKYNDVNRNAQRDVREVSLAGWTFTVRDNAGATVATLTTGTDGTAAIANLPPGNYVVTESPQPGWTSTDPGGSRPTKAVGVVAQSTTSVRFGNAIVRLPSTATHTDGEDASPATPHESLAATASHGATSAELAVSRVSRSRR